MVNLEKRQLRHPCIPPISVAGSMHPTNQRAREPVVAYVDHIAPCHGGSKDGAYALRSLEAITAVRSKIASYPGKSIDNYMTQ